MECSDDARHVPLTDASRNFVSQKRSTTKINVIRTYSDILFFLYKPVQNGCSYQLLLSTTDFSIQLPMVHSSRFYQYASYEEFQDNGMFSTEENCMQFLYDMKILRTHHKCPTCMTPMDLIECPTNKYRDGCCWKCTCSAMLSSSSDLMSSDTTSCELCLICNFLRYIIRVSLINFISFILIIT